MRYLQHTNGMVPIPSVQYGQLAHGSGTEDGRCFTLGASAGDSVGKVMTRRQVSET